jgi:hypothetical protein
MQGLVGQVISFKLNSGEEMIAKLIDLVDDCLVLTDPVSVIPGPRGVGLQQSMFTGHPGKEVRLNTMSISLFAETEDGVKMKYIEATTGIRVPEKKLILG